MTEISPERAFFGCRKPGSVYAAFAQRVASRCLLNSRVVEKKIALDDKMQLDSINDLDAWGSRSQQMDGE